MSLLGPASPLSAAGVRSPWDVAAPREIQPPRAPASTAVAPSGEGFGNILGRLVGGVEDRQAEAASITRSVLLGENQNLHQSVLAMQEASLSFGLMVEVRNKVVESYQELMRMPG